MPVKPENRRHYKGKAWRSAKAAVHARAGGRCECTGECGAAHDGGRCGAPDRAFITRDELEPHRWRPHGACSLCLGGDPGCQPVQVVLTVAHLDHDPTRHDPERLRHFCQRCHNVYDSPLRQANAAATRARKRLEAARAAGQGELKWRSST